MICLHTVPAVLMIMQYCSNYIGQYVVMQSSFSLIVVSNIVSLYMGIMSLPMCVHVMQAHAVQLPTV